MESEIQEYRAQLAAIEGLLAEEPNNQELIGVRDQLRDIVRLATEVDDLKQPTTDMFADDNSVHEDDKFRNDPPQQIELADAREEKSRKNLINFQKKEELHYKDGKMITELSTVPNNQSNFDMDMDDDSFSSSDYTSDSSDDEQKQIAKEYSEQNQPTISANTSTELVDSRFTQIADWEQYTKGIGLKLLAKYGYKKGQGVGRHKIGIAEPISLDEQTGNSKAGLGHTKRRRHKRLPGDTRPSKRARKSGQADVSQAAGGANYKPDYENGENVFDYINKRTTQQQHAKEKDIDLKKYTRVELEKKHHELLKTLGEVKVQIDKYEMSYQRNIGRDPTTAAEVKKQLDALHEQFVSVGRQEKLLRTKLEMKKNRAKMKEF